MCVTGILNRTTSAWAEGSGESVHAGTARGMASSNGGGGGAKRTAAASDADPSPAAGASTSAAPAAAARASTSAAARRTPWGVLMATRDATGQFFETAYRQLLAVTSAHWMEKGVALSDPLKPDRDLKRNQKRREAGNNTWSSYCAAPQFEASSSASADFPGAAVPGGERGDGDQGRTGSGDVGVDTAIDMDVDADEDDQVRAREEISGDEPPEEEGGAEDDEDDAAFDEEFLAEVRREHVTEPEPEVGRCKLEPLETSVECAWFQRLEAPDFSA